jgi:hypothetical protein
MRCHEGNAATRGLVGMPHHDPEWSPLRFGARRRCPRPRSGTGGRFRPRGARLSSRERPGTSETRPVQAAERPPAPERSPCMRRQSRQDSMERSRRETRQDRRGHPWQDALPGFTIMRIHQFEGGSLAGNDWMPQSSMMSQPRASPSSDGFEGPDDGDVAGSGDTARMSVTGGSHRWASRIALTSQACRSHACAHALSALSVCPGSLVPDRAVTGQHGTGTPAHGRQPGS